jgi:peroxiredoxin
MYRLAGAHKETSLARLRSLSPVIALATLALATAAPAHAAGRNLTGQPAPEIHVARAVQGLPSATPASWRGKVVVLKFWFSGCPACRASLPQFQSLYERYASRGVQFLALAYEDADEAGAFVARQGYTFPVGADPQGVTPSRFGVVSYPTSYVIGADGVVRSYDDLSAAVIERELAPARPAAPVARDRNVSELGDVPAALAGVREAAARNDYGAVARLVRDHKDPRRDGNAVAQASVRIENIARERWNHRAERVRARWDGGDPAGAWADLARLADDFHDTKFGDATLAWRDQFPRVPGLATATSKPRTAGTSATASDADSPAASASADVSAH